VATAANEDANAIAPVSSELVLKLIATVDEISFFTGSTDPRALLLRPLGIFTGN